jgi:hypothetical protein
VERWLLTHPTLAMIRQRLGPPDGTGGSGLRIWFYRLGPDRVLSVEMSSGQTPTLVYASVSTKSDNRLLWEHNYGR